MCETQGYEVITDESMEIEFAKRHVKENLRKIIDIIESKISLIDRTNDPKILMRLKGELLMEILKTFPRRPEHAAG